MTQVVGRPTPRVEGELKVTGKALYSADLNLPDTLWGKVLRSPISYGRIKSIDISKAWQVPGVKAVITGQDVAGLRIGRCIYDTPVLADGVCGSSAKRSPRLRRRLRRRRSARWI